MEKKSQVSEQNFTVVLQLTVSPWTTEASTREIWQFGAL